MSSHSRIKNILFNQPQQHNNTNNNDTKDKDNEIQ